ncbi:MAG: DUF1919 domain-containing protein [Muribaculum sp.]|nr:DUF1919 domain-containing protein [Muribaculum sp.]
MIYSGINTTPPQIIFRKKQRKRLKLNSISLLTGNCIGGYLYHQLGLQFNSPTINMMIKNPDFLKLILKPEYYMSVKPKPYQSQEFPEIPCAKLDDIVLHFTHYSSVEQGINAWCKRRERIDYENLYIIISDIGLDNDDIKKLSQVRCKKLVLMTCRKYNYDYCLYIPEYEGMEHVGQLLGKTLCGKWNFERYFDFVGWVNSNDPIAQHFYIGKK